MPVNERSKQSEGVSNMCSFAVSLLLADFGPQITKKLFGSSDN